MGTDKIINMEIIDGIKVFHEYASFYRYIDNYDGELDITIGGDVYEHRVLKAKFNFIKK